MSDARKIAAERLAKGEITQSEYIQIIKILDEGDNLSAKDIDDHKDLSKVGDINPKKPKRSGWAWIIGGIILLLIIYPMVEAFEHGDAMGMQAVTGIHERSRFMSNFVAIIAVAFISLGIAFKLGYLDKRK